VDGVASSAADDDGTQAVAQPAQAEAIGLADPPRPVDESQPVESAEAEPEMETP
jgi:hypothetical protein